MVMLTRISAGDGYNGTFLFWYICSRVLIERILFRIQLISNGALFVCELLFLRETRGSLLLARRAKQMRKETGDQRYRAPSELEARSMKDLLYASTTRAALLLFREPVVFSFSLWLAFAWGMVFLFFSVVSVFRWWPYVCSDSTLDLFNLRWKPWV